MAYSSIFRTNCASPWGHTRVHAARIFSDVARGNHEMFDAFGPQLNTFMSVGIFASLFSS